MNQTETKIYRAEWVLPIVGEPIENGEVIIKDGRIVEAREARPNTEPTRDFGAAILMPGLVNVHTHLDYTIMRGLLEDREFGAWIQGLQARKMALALEDWIASATWGAAEALAGGVTTIGDCTDSGAACAGALALGLGGVIYQEVFGIDESQTVNAIIQELQGKVEQLKRGSAGSRLRIGVSPHSPYTVRPELFRALKIYTSAENLRLCVHAAESRAEAELLLHGSGPIAEMYERRGIEWTPPQMSAVAYLDSFGLLGPETLLVHGVQSAASDRHILAARDFGWAYCPKSNAKLGNGAAPLGLMGRAQGTGNREQGTGNAREEEDKTQEIGNRKQEAEQSKTQNPTPKTQNLIPRIGIGSDSVASNNAMDLFEEMRFGVLMQRGARRKINALTAREAVEMATLGGARALGLDAEIGTLEPGKRADLCAVALHALHAVPAYDPYSALVYAASASDVLCTLIAGEIKYDAAGGTRPEQRFPNADIAPLREKMRVAARKMRAF